jgi:hypothetical protein
LTVSFESSREVPNVLDVPLNVCVAENVLATFVTGIFAPANVVAPVPPLPTGKVPVTFVVRLTKVVDVLPVPPLAIGKVPVTFEARFTKVVDVLPVPPLAIGKVPVTFDARFTKVVDVLPVPPLAIGNAVPE